MGNVVSHTVSAEALIRTEAEALLRLADRIAGTEAKAFSALLDTLEATVGAGRRVVTTGMGKSGLIARKIAATLTSLSVPSTYLHPAEALHGDLGMLRAGDALLALSYSGETEELLRLMPALTARRVTLAVLTGCPASTLGRHSAHCLDVSVEREACAHQLAPTASTTAMLALGDALAVCLSERLGFAPETFAALHPGGALGRRLTPVQGLAHTGVDCPVVAPDAAMPAVIHEMSARRLGMTTVQDDAGRLLGLLSDGDLRRLLERDGPEAFHRRAHEVMNTHPRTVGPGVFAADALDLLEQHKITALVLTDDGTSTGTVCGVVHLHDLVEALRMAAPESAAGEPNAP